MITEVAIEVVAELVFVFIWMGILVIGCIVGTDPEPDTKWDDIS